MNKTKRKTKRKRKRMSPAKIILFPLVLVEEIIEAGAARVVLWVIA